MPERTITVPVLPIPDVPNAAGILYKGKAINDAIEVYMNLPVKHVMLQTTQQVGDSRADIELDKLCGYVTKISFDETSKSYAATIKLIPNKNSGMILTALAEGNSFTLGTNKVGSLNKILDGEVTDYPPNTKFVCDEPLDIVSVSLLPDSVLKEVEDATKSST
jgi:hypothetical protein